MSTFHGPMSCIHRATDEKTEIALALGTVHFLMREWRLVGFGKHPLEIA